MYKEDGQLTINQDDIDRDDISTTVHIESKLPESSENGSPVNFANCTTYKATISNDEVKKVDELKKDDEEIEVIDRDGQYPGECEDNRGFNDSGNNNDDRGNKDNGNNKDGENRELW